MNLSPATYRLFYNNRNITSDISDHLISLTYTDKVAGEADELEIQLEDTDAMWQNNWYPEKGAVLTAQIVQDDTVLDCGAFGIDETAFSFGAGGDTVTIRALSAFFSKKLRTKRSTAHENKSLAEIARTVADRHSLKISGSIPDITLGRVSQHKKNDLAFLQSIALDYGYAFSVKGGIMVFTDITTLEKGRSVLTIDKADCIDGSITDKSSNTYKKATVKFHNPTDKVLVEHSSAEDGSVAGSDTLEIRTKAENKQQAERIAAAGMHRHNSYQQSGNLTVDGSPVLVSGVNFELVGAGKLSGLFHINQSTHNVSRDNAYTTALEIKKVGSVAAAKYISKAKKASPVKVSNTKVTNRTNRDNVGFNYIQ